VVIPEPQGSWVLPLDTARRSMAVGTPTQLAIAQLQAVLAVYPGGAPQPVVVMDSHYDMPALVAASLGVDLLARLASNRRFYRAPPPYAGTGRPRTHGHVLRLADATTQGAPDHVQVFPDPAYGQVTLTLWTALHTQGAPEVTVTIIRIDVAHPLFDT
jgi:hypothetical protein